MANSAGLCTSFLKELLQGVHSFCQDGTNASPVNVTPVRDSSHLTDTFKGALVYASGSFSPDSFTNYSQLGSSEVANGNGYTTGGATIQYNNGQAITSGRSGCVTPSASIQWTGITITTAFDTLAIYNSSQGGRAVSLHNFGSQTITAGTLTLTMPVNAATTALCELAGQ